jgi:diguanylate cyclase (GGDEF)-like protein
MADTRAGARGIGPAGYLIIAYALGFAVVVVSGFGGSIYRTAIIDVGQLAMPAVAMAFSYLTFRRVRRPRERLAWLFFSMAALTLLAGFAAAFWVEVVRGDQGSTAAPLVAVAWLLFYPLAFGGLALYLPRRRRGPGGVTVILDALILTVLALALVWRPLLQPALAGSEGAQGAVQLGWAFGGLLLLFGLSSHVLRWPLDRVPLTLCLLTCAFALQVSADTAYSVLSLRGVYEVGSFVDILWPFSSGLLALAALARLRRPGRQGKRRPGLSAVTLDLAWTAPFRVALPYAALPVAALVLFQGHASSSSGVMDPGARTSVVLGVSLVGLVIVRQLVVVVENVRLSRSLAGLSQELEARVDERTLELSARTSQLAALNRVATRLSHCLSLDEVLASGLRLACEAADVQVGAIWLVERGGEPRLAARLGLSPDGDDLVNKLPRRIPAAREALAGGVLAMVEDYSLQAYLPASSAQRLPHVRMLAVPLLSRDSVVGLLGLFGSESQPEQTRSLAESIGAQLGVAVDNARRYEEAVDLADRDPLTGLLNHRAVHARLEQELRRANRSGLDCAILMMDLDAFKALNDSYGHQVGDVALKDVAAVLRSVVRASDVVGRYGGDEFLAILPDTGAESARILAERLVEALAERRAFSDGPADRLGMSIGVASAPADGRSGTELVAVADANMYLSKQRGGSRVTAAQPQLEPMVSPAAVA